jgi:hypothetical protein
MIITKEKYKNTYIVYIDESIPNQFESHWQTYPDEDTSILMTNILNCSLRRPRLGERRMDII